MKTHVYLNDGRVFYFGDTLRIFNNQHTHTYDITYRYVETEEISMKAFYFDEVAQIVVRGS